MNKAIKKYTGSLIMLAILCFASLISSCKHENLSVPKPNENIRPAADFIRNNYDFRLFYAALEYTGLVEELNGKGPFTILAITDAAFNQEGIRSIEDIRKLNRDSLKQAMQYHILKNRKLVMADIPTNAIDVRYETLSGDELYVSAATANNYFFFSGSLVTRPDVTLANGVLHVLVKMMKYHKGSSVQNLLAKNHRYSLYVSALKKFGLWDKLAGDGPFTVFAPTDSAFKVNGITAADIDCLNPAGYYGGRLFGAYIMSQKHFFISDKYVFKAIGGEYTYEIGLPNDDWFVRFQTDEGYSQQVNGLPYPQISIMNPHGQYGLEEAGKYWPPYGGPLPAIAGFDHLCDNGVVHDIPDLMLLPQQAIK